MDYSFTDFEIMDAHTHIFPGKIAEKAAISIGTFYGMAPHSSAEPHVLMEKSAPYGVKKLLVCSVATTPKQVIGANDFIAKKCGQYERFMGFGTLHPDYEDVGSEIERMLSLGLKGIKLHPDFQKFNIDAPEAYKIYEAAQGRLPILLHMGDDRYDFSAPHRLKHAMRDFPHQRFIAAHLGGYKAWEQAREELHGGENLKFDTSSALFALPDDYAVEQIRILGAENCFFGTDFPLWDYGTEVERFFKLDLSYDEAKMILAGNFKEFFKED